MLNYETLLSSYDDRLTLMQWLKKVEDALKDASAVSFDVVNYGNATLAFKIVFADGTSIESDKFVLQQGDSVQSAAIVNGHLILTLTNGDEIDAGNMFNGNVSISGKLAVSQSMRAEQPEMLQEITTFFKDTGGTIQWDNINTSFAKIQLNAHVIDLVLFMSFVSDGSTSFTFRFNIPAQIGDKLVTSFSNVIEVKNIMLTGITGSSMVQWHEARAVLYKAWSGSLYMILYNVPASLAQCDRVMFRYYFEGIE